MGDIWDVRCYTLMNTIKDNPGNFSLEDADLTITPHEFIEHYNENGGVGTQILKPIRFLPLAFPGVFTFEVASEHNLCVLYRYYPPAAMPQAIQSHLGLTFCEQKFIFELESYITKNELRDFLFRFDWVLRNPAKRRFIPQMVKIGAMPNTFIEGAYKRAITV